MTTHGAQPPHAPANPVEVMREHIPALKPHLTHPQMAAVKRLIVHAEQLEAAAALPTRDAAEYQAEVDALRERLRLALEREAACRKRMESAEAELRKPGYESPEPEGWRVDVCEVLEVLDESEHVSRHIKSAIFDAFVAYHSAVGKP